MIYVTDVVVSGHSFSFLGCSNCKDYCKLQFDEAQRNMDNKKSCSLLPSFSCAGGMIFRIVKAFAGLPNHVVCPLRWLCAGAGLSDAAWGAFQDERGRPGGLCKAVETH